MVYQIISEKNEKLEIFVTASNSVHISIESANYERIVLTEQDFLKLFNLIKKDLYGNK